MCTNQSFLMAEWDPKRKFKNASITECNYCFFFLLKVFNVNGCGCNFPMPIEYALFLQKLPELIIKTEGSFTYSDCDCDCDYLRFR